MQEPRKVIGLLAFAELKCGCGKNMTESIGIIHLQSIHLGFHDTTFRISEFKYLVNRVCVIFQR